MVKGFHLKNDGQRVAMEYSSQAERCWCELSELVSARLWDEADAREVEYCERAHPYVDWKLMLQLKGRVIDWNLFEGMDLPNQKEYLSTASLGREQYQSMKELIGLAHAKDQDDNELWGIARAVILQRAVELGAPSFLDEKRYRDAVLAQSQARREVWPLERKLHPFSPSADVLFLKKLHSENPSVYDSVMSDAYRKAWQDLSPEEQESYKVQAQKAKQEVEKELMETTTAEERETIAAELQQARERIKTMKKPTAPKQSARPEDFEELLEVCLDAVRITMALTEGAEVLRDKECCLAEEMAGKLIERGDHAVAAKHMRTMLDLCGEEDAGDYTAGDYMKLLANTLRGIGSADAKHEAARLYRKLIAKASAQAAKEKEAEPEGVDEWRAALAQCESLPAEPAPRAKKKAKTAKSGAN